MNQQLTKQKGIALVVFDWAGTLIDHGSQAPMQVFVDLFAAHGVEITVEEARKPMGMAKRDHIATLLTDPAIADAWNATHERSPGDSDIDALYAEFHPMQMKTIRSHCELIGGAAEMIENLRMSGIGIGSTTGYTRELMNVIAPLVRDQGLAIDSMLCADDMTNGRPAPWLIYETAKSFNVYPMNRVIKVDDTVVGVEAGRNAGVWTVGVSRTGNLVGLSESEFAALSEPAQRTRIEQAEEQLRGAGAHYVIESIAELPRVILEIEYRMGDQSKLRWASGRSTVIAAP